MCDYIWLSASLVTFNPAEKHLAPSHSSARPADAALETPWLSLYLPGKPTHTHGLPERPLKIPAEEATLVLPAYLTEAAQSRRLRRGTPFRTGRTSRQKWKKTAGRSILPIQCKGVVESDVWVSHGVKGGKLLQRLHQLHNGLVILKQKQNKHQADELFAPALRRHPSVHLCPPRHALIRAWSRS